jgi:hypothetical protein
MTISCTCENPACGKVFEKEAYQFQKSNHHFCCRSCSVTFFNHVSPKRSKQLRVCVVCGVPVHRFQKRCDEHRRKQKVVSPLQAVKTHYQLRKAQAIEYKGGSCCLCGYKRTPRSLHFHHNDPSQKDFKISGGNMSWERMKAELDKCILVCANCHGEIHDGLIELGGTGGI